MEKLEIRYNLVKEDGTIVETYGSSFDTNADWLETWLIQYKNETCIVDSQNNIILLGKYEINEKEWFQLDEHDIKLEEYPTFLDRLTAFIDYINRNEKPLVDGRCIAFDLLCKSPYVENLEKFVWAAEIPLEIYQAYQEEKLETE